MSVTGTYSPPGGGPPYGGSASAESWSTLDDLLVQLPDNTANLIVAKNIRDSVFTLWDRIDTVEVIAASAASASSFFQNPAATPITVGGIPSGSSFPTPTNMQDMWDQLLYPYIAPGAGFSPASSSREFGANLLLNLNWSATTNSETITTILVDGNAQSPVAPPPNPQTGVEGVVGTHSSVPGTTSENNVFSMSVGDGTSTTNSNYTLTWKNRIFWGYIDLASIGNPNLTTNPGSASIVASLCTDNAIKALNGANANGSMLGSELATSKNKTYTGIDGEGKHLIFAWPSTVSGANAPAFSVNNLPNTAFTKVRTDSTFVNQFGFSGTNYEVWVSNTLQNSPLNIVIS
jgi:hypothetical protein